MDKVGSYCRTPIEVIFSLYRYVAIPTLGKILVLRVIKPIEYALILRSIYFAIVIEADIALRGH